MNKIRIRVPCYTWVISKVTGLIKINILPSKNDQKVLTHDVSNDVDLKSKSLHNAQNFEK